MKNPSVSVCVPTYNGSKYLSECLDSILMQTYSDFEVLIVDDCSSDETVEIARRYAQIDGRVCVARNKVNLGLVGNWNKCVELAKGEWIKFVFQDDLIDAKCIAEMVSVCDPDTLLVACARNFLFDIETPENVQQLYWKNRQRIIDTWGQEKRISAKRFCIAKLIEPGANLMGEPTTVLLHHTVFKRFGKFNTSLMMSCDLEYWARVAVNAGFVRVLEPLATFRVHSDAASYEIRTDRSYRMKVLDDLVIWHDFAYHPAYEPLRLVASEQQPQLDPKARFMEKAKIAWNLAKNAATDSLTPDLSLMKEWEEVARYYPRLTELFD